MADLIKNEEDVLAYWRSNNIIASIRSKNRGKKPFYFLDGPPFVSGDLHPGQMWVKSMKDAILRYKRLRGYDVYDRAGYDVHGLPIEMRAESSLNVKSKKEIETRIGVEKFVRSCKEYVEAYIGRMDADYERFGISLDFSNPYLPYKKEYIETEWAMFKKMYDKGFIYKEKKVVPYCTRCGTVLSQGSMEVVYQNDPDPSIFVAVKAVKSGKIEIDDNTYLLIWTTTPWTLIANIAIAVNPEAKYVTVKIADRKYVLAKDRLDSVVSLLGESAVVEAEYFGSELVGTKYKSILQSKVPAQTDFERYHRVIAAKEIVSTEEGTGLVHIAPGHGLDDYRIGKKEKLPIFSPIDKDGVYTEEAGAYKGLKVPEEANAKMIEDLKAEGVLVSSGTLVHSYPHCWRCNTKLIYLATDQWFANIQRIKKKAISENRKVSWHPAEAQKWQEELLESSPDWVVSRQRYWGVPMPIWEGDGTVLVIGSLDELKAHAVDRAKVDTLQDLHRPYIDEIVLQGPNGEKLHRVSDVLDVWFDSSIAFRASLTDEQFEKLFPMDFILEAVEQLRGWFSYQIKSSVMIYGKRPFKNVVMHGMMLGEDGRELHKHLGNYIPLHELLKQTTADSFRLWCVSHNPRLDLLFRIKDIQEANKVIMLLYNIANLYKEYSSSAGYVPKKVKAPRALNDYEDAWIVSRLNSTLNTVTESFDNYEIDVAANSIKRFIVEDFSRLYLKIAKKRIAESKAQARKKINTINYILRNMLLAISPITPFAAEKIYLDLYSDKKSIFLNDWPHYKAKLINKELEEDFTRSYEAIAALLYAREHANIKLRQPLENAEIETSNDDAFNSMLKLEQLIEEYTNIKKVTIKKVSNVGERLMPVFSKIGPAFKENAQIIAKALQAAIPEEVNKEIAVKGDYELHTEKGTFKILPEHFTIVKTKEEGAIAFAYGVVRISTEISKALKEEAMVREIERRIQLARKMMELRKYDVISVNYEADEGIAEQIQLNKNKIMRAVNAKNIKLGLEPEPQPTEFKIENSSIKLQIKKEEKE
ncbi:MAG: isoleucine--tRNA ligase [Candidatus Micrarchaeaceae archaeon]